MSSLLLRNIKELVQVDNQGMGFKKGPAMADLPTLKNAWLLVEDGRFKAFGSMDTCPERADEVLDVSGRMVFPSWVDSHTHLVFAHSRENEFVDRINGLTYAEIAQKGGGILNSAKRLQDADENQLYEAALQRLSQLQKMGTGAIEIKSGYGLSIEGELKMLRVIRRLKENTRMPIRATFLGAHAYPLEYRENHEEYLKILLNKILPQIVEEGLADYIDVFCEKGFFSVVETERILAAGQKAGLTPKIHTNQFNCMGGIQAAVKYGALSVDHLEVLNEEEIECLRQSDTIPTFLPSAPFFLNDHYPPARKMIESGLGVALASDFNPGSSPSGRMSLVISLACIKMRMLPEEAINAATINGAYALQLEEELGSIMIGKQANFFVTQPMSSIAYLPYSFGQEMVDRSYLDGKEGV